MSLSGQDILTLIKMRDVFAQIRALRAYRGTQPKRHRGIDRKLGPTARVNSIHNLRHAVNKGFVYSA